MILIGSDILDPKCFQLDIIDESKEGTLVLKNLVRIHYSAVNGEANIN